MTAVSVFLVNASAVMDRRYRRWRYLMNGHSKLINAAGPASDLGAVSAAEGWDCAAVSAIVLR